MAQLARWTGPLTEGEAETIAVSYLGRRSGQAVNTIANVLLVTPPAQ
jgi:hypothetical protein